jgi:maltose alpha-D-glucosyltransferase/alpha-amylase
MQADGPLEVVYAERNRYPFVFRRGGLLFAFNPSALGAEAPVRPQGTPVFAVGGKAVFEEKSIRMAPQSLVVIRQNP